MSPTKALDMVKLDLEKLEEIRRSLPDQFVAHMLEIPAAVGKAYQVTSLSGTDHTWRTSVDNSQGFWVGKCECTGWPHTKSTKYGRNPCTHIVAALLVDDRFDWLEELRILAHRPERLAMQEQKPEKAPNPEPVTHEPEVVDPEQPQEKVEEVHHSLKLEVVPIDKDAPALVAPVASIEEVAAVFEAFQQAKTSLLKKGDVQPIKKGTFIKKSGWRKIAVFFGISCSKLAEGYAPGTGNRVWQVTYRAMARNGTYQDATGYCSWDEAACVGRASKGAEGVAKNEHDVRSTAETRAKNRAISDLVGGGEVSAEEMQAMS